MRLEPNLRGVFAALADVLVPEADGKPSASRAGVTTHLVDQALDHRPDLVEDFLAALRFCAQLEPEAALDALAVQHPARFQALAVLTAGAYSVSPEARDALGIVFAPVAVKDDTDTYIDLLAEVVDRGFDIRRTPLENRTP